MKKIFTTLLITILMTGQVIGPVIAAPERPSKPATTDTITTNPDNPDTPDKPVPVATATPIPTPTPTPVATATPTPIPTPEPVLAVVQAPTDSSNNQVGDVNIETGDAEGTGIISNTGNTNLSSQPDASDALAGDYGGISIINEANGTESENTASIVLDDSSETIQDNNANLDNTLEVVSDSGENSASQNVGDSSIETGDANATGTIINSVNTNIEGVMVSEFNIIDDHVGDFVLDYEANCVSGCSETDINLENTKLELLSSDVTFQTNLADINNELILEANTGINTTDNNVGDSSIKTGDANVSGNVLNFANNNIAGNVVYGVVNIFGNLIGDIIMPEPDNYVVAYADPAISLSNNQNGTGSTNLAEADITNTDEYFQFNNIELANNIEFDVETGGNTASNNTAGDVSIETGDIDIDAQVINIANSNIIGGDWWIALVNDAGNWFGVILGGPESLIGSHFAAAPGTGVETQDNGAINISNASINSLNENLTIQENDAVITNNISLTANTGGNSASRNVGDASIETGDAKAMLNLINFANNNFAGGNVFLTVVNVFGSWVGDFVTPGASAQDDTDTDNTDDNDNDSGTGGNGDVPNNDNNNDSSSGSGGSSNDGGSNNNSDNNIASNNNYINNSVLGFSDENCWLEDEGCGDENIASLLDEISDEAIGNDSDNDKTRINLAWLFLIIPLLVILKIGQKVIRN